MFDAFPIPILDSVACFLFASFSSSPLASSADSAMSSSLRLRNELLHEEIDPFEECVEHAVDRKESVNSVIWVMLTTLSWTENRSETN